MKGTGEFIRDTTVYTLDDYFHEHPDGPDSFNPLYRPLGVSTQEAATALVRVFGSRLPAPPTPEPQWTEEGKYIPLSYQRIYDSQRQWGRTPEEAAHGLETAFGVHLYWRFGQKELGGVYDKNTGKMEIFQYEKPTAPIEVAPEPIVDSTDGIMLCGYDEIGV